MTNQEIIATGQTIANETHIGGNTAERVGGVIEGIGENLTELGGNLYETGKEEVSLNTESGKYIADSGNLAGGAGATDFAVKYIPCSQGEKYVLTYPNNGPSNGNARVYAVYNAEDVASASSSNVLARGYFTKNVVANEEIEIEVTDSNAKLLCVTQFVAGLVNLTPTLKKVTEVNRLDKLESEVAEIDSRKEVIYDVSAHNSDAVFESLSALLNSSNLDTLIPALVRCGGMSIRFIQGSVPNAAGNKYVQYRLMSDTFNTTPTNWQGIDDEPILGSNNLVKSGGVKNELVLGTVYDVSAHNNGATYETLTLALNAVPTNDRRGGMTVKFIQFIPATYNVVKTEGLTEQPTGTALSNASTIASGTYTAAQLGDFTTLPSITGSANAITYYIAITVDEVTTYISWVIAKVTDDAQKYVEYRNTSTAWSTIVSDWQEIDNGVWKEVNLDIVQGGLNIRGGYIEATNRLRSSEISREFKLRAKDGYAIYFAYKYDISGAPIEIFAQPNNIRKELAGNLTDGQYIVVTLCVYGSDNTDITFSLDCVKCWIKKDVVNNFYGGKEVALSAEMGKQLDERLKAVSKITSDIDDEPSYYSNKLVKSSGIFNSYNNAFYDAVELNDSLVNKYIGDNGNIGTAEGYTIFYIRCSKGDKLKLLYNSNGPSNAGGLTYAIYNVDNINDASKANVVLKGFTFKTVIAETTYEIDIVNDDAKFIVFQQYIGGLLRIIPQVSKKTYKSKFDSIEEKLQDSTFKEIIFEDADYIENSYIVSSGNLGTSDTFGVYKVPCTEGDKFKLFTFKNLGSSISRSYAIYNSTTVFNGGTVIDVGSLSVNGAIEIEITDSNAKMLLIGWRTVADITLFKRNSESVFDGIDRKVTQLQFDAPKVHFEYEHTLKQTNIREVFDLSDNIREDYYGLTGMQSIMFQLQNKLSELAENNPTYITKFDAVELVGLQYPIYANGIEEEGTYKVTPRYRTYGFKLSYVNPGVNGKTNRPTRILITSGIHGNEQSASLNLYTFVKELCDDYLSDINLFKMRGAFEFYIIPCVSGYTSIHRNRLNANGVNINRNYPVDDWANQGSDVIGDSAYRGPSAGSEFETQLVMALLNKISPDIYIDHHNYSQNDKLQFYTEMTDARNIRMAYDCLADVSYTLKKSFPQWFGSQYLLLKGDETTKFEGRAPADVDIVSRATGSTWAFLKGGIKFALTLEISGAINYNNGALSGHDAYCEQVYQIGEYTLVNQIKRYGEYVTNNLVSPRYTDWDSKYIE